MLDLQKAVPRRVRRPHRLVPDVLAVLDLLRAIIQVPGRVEIKVNGVVAQRRQDVLAVFLADGKGWST